MSFFFPGKDRICFCCDIYNGGNSEDHCIWLCAAFWCLSPKWMECVRFRHSCYWVSIRHLWIKRSLCVCERENGWGVQCVCLCICMHTLVKTHSQYRYRVILPSPKRELADMILHRYLLWMKLRWCIKYTVLFAFSLSPQWYLAHSY